MLPGTFFCFGGKSVVPGSQNYTSPGTYTFPVPADYNSLTVTVNGAGAGGTFEGQLSFPASGVFYNPGTNGGDSSFGSVVAHGGKPLTGSGSATPGDASGGDTNTTGGGAPGGANNGLASGTGGPGGKAIKTWASGAPGAPAGTVTVVVGAGGSPGSGNSNPGENGSVSISWN